MIIFLIIFLIILLIYFLFFYNVNPFTTVMYLGKKGSGKSCKIAQLAFYYHKKGWSVYSNIKVPFSFYFDPLNIETCTFKPYSVVLIDEVGLIWDNRNFKNFPKSVNEFFKFSRHFKVKVILFSQSFDIDLKIRSLVDHMFLISRFGLFSFSRPVIKKIGVKVDDSGVGSLVDTYALGSVFSSQICFLPRYWNLFDSFLTPKRELIYSIYCEPTNFDFNFYFLHKYFAYLLNFAFTKIKSNLLNLLTFLKKVCVNLRGSKKKL